MSGDLLGDIIKDVLREKINQWVDEKKSDQEIKEKLGNIHFKDVISKGADKATKNLLEELKPKCFEMSTQLKTDVLYFVASQEKKWGNCFAVSDAMYVLATEAAKYYTEYVMKDIGTQKENLKYTFLCLQHIHGRVCQEFFEVLCLTRLGFADGAYARWRCMYELSCIGWFIREKGEQIAKQYLEQSQSEDKSYNWASGAIDSKGKQPKQWNFDMIQKECNQKEIWKNQYRIACFVTHGSPQGTMKRMANGKTLNIVPIGQSDYGIAIPVEHAARSLALTTNLFLNIFPYADGIVYCKVINDWVNIIRDEYFSTHQNLFNESLNWTENEV